MKRAILILLMLCLAAAPAFGDVKQRKDDRDTKGPVDLRLIRHGHGGASIGVEKVRHVLSSHRRWRLRRISCNGGTCRGMFDVSIDTDRDGENERLVQLYRLNGKLRAAVHRFTEDCGPIGSICTSESRRLGYARVWRPDRKSVAFAMRTAWLGRDVESYRWNVSLTIFRNQACPENSGEAPSSAPRDFYCVDFAPQRYGSDTVGWITHRL